MIFYNEATHLSSFQWNDALITSTCMKNECAFANAEKSKLTYVFMLKSALDSIRQIILVCNKICLASHSYPRKIFPLANMIALFAATHGIDNVHRFYPPTEEFPLKPAVASLAHICQSSVVIFYCISSGLSFTNNVHWTWIHVRKHRKGQPDTVFLTLVSEWMWV